MSAKGNKNYREQPMSHSFIGCSLKKLPPRLLTRAARTAAQINPVNAPVLGPQSTLIEGFEISEPQHIALMTSKYWGPTPRVLSVSFMESTPSDLKAKILDHMNAWGKTACISFALTNSTGEVRISRGSGGYYSYLGTDILHIPNSQQTMNLQGFTINTQDSEFYRVVRHETGHTLGFPHEHMRQEIVELIDPQKAYDWFWQTQGWDQAIVDAQVLTPLDESSLMETPPDVTSIMCYQLPGDITKNGDPIPGGTDIDASDYKFAGKIYPKSDESNGEFSEVTADDWPEADDVEVHV